MSATANPVILNNYQRLRSERAWMNAALSGLMDTVAEKQGVTSRHYKQLAARHVAGVERLARLDARIAEIEAELGGS